MIILDAKKRYELKAALDEYIAASRLDATDDDLTRLYATSVMAFSAANFWGDNVAAVPFRVMQPSGEVLPEDSPHPLARIFYRSAFGALQRNSTVTTLFWGRNLLHIERNFASTPMALRWINPNLWRVDARTHEGLVGFEIYPGRYHIAPTGYLKPHEAVFTHELDFNDEFDGISSAEVAFLQAGTEVEIAQTVLSSFRNNAIPAMLIMPAADQSPKPNEDTARMLAGLLKRVYQGAVNAGKAAVDYFRWEVLKLQPDFDKLALRDLNQHVREMVAMAFDVPVEFFTTGQTTYAELEGKIDLWRRQRLKPRVLRSAEAYTEQLCRQFGPGWRVEPDFSELLKEDEAATFALVKEELNSTIIDLFTAQKRMKVENPPVAFRGLFMVEGIPVPVHEIANYWRYKLLVAPSVFNTPEITGEPLPQPVEPGSVIPTEAPGGNVTGDPVGVANPPSAAPAGSPDGTATPADKSFCVMLMVGAQPGLIELQNRAKKWFAASPVSWNAPDDFHVTLVYAPVCTDVQAAQFVEAFREIALPDLALSVGSLKLFDALGENALHFRIRKNADLIAYQERLFEAADTTGMGLSEYSEPEDWIAHITIGYIQKRVSSITFRGNRTVTPISVRIMLGDTVLFDSAAPEEGEAETETPPDSKAALYIPDDVFAELKVAARKGRAFVPDKLPAATAAYVGELVELGFGQDAVIDAARKHYAGVSAAKAIQATRLDFEGDFEDLLASARSEKMTRARFGTVLRALLNRYATRAYRDGMVDGGVDADLDDDDRSALAAYLSEQSAFVTAIGNALYKGEGISDDQAANKPLQWFNGSIYPAYLKGLESAALNGMFEWVIGRTEEHCRSCLALNGQRHPLRVWKKSGFYPKSDKLICGPGKLCDCNFVPAPGAKGRGQLASVPALKSHEAHIHAEETA